MQGLFAIRFVYFRGTLHSGLKKYFYFKQRRSVEKDREILNWLIQNSKENSQISRRTHSRRLFSGSKILTGTQFDSSNGRQTFTILVKEKWPADSMHEY